MRWRRGERPPSIETTTLTVAAGASAVEIDAACRAVLATIWPDLDWFNLDLTTLGQTPEQVRPVAALQRHRTRTLFRGRPTQLVHIELGASDGVDGADGAALEAVLPLLTSTLGSDGWSSELERIVYDVNDQGTSCWFELSAQQRAGAEARLRDMGVSTGVLEPLP